MPCFCDHLFRLLPNLDDASVDLVMQRFRMALVLSYSLAEKNKNKNKNENEGPKETHPFSRIQIQLLHFPMLEKARQPNPVIRHMLLLPYYNDFVAFALRIELQDLLAIGFFLPLVHSVP
jgi:hypothetical protein